MAIPLNLNWLRLNVCLMEPLGGRNYLYTKQPRRVFLSGASINGCESCGFDHRFGSESFCSMVAKSDLRRGASKILPQVADFIAHGSVSEVEIV